MVFQKKKKKNHNLGIHAWGWEKRSFGGGQDFFFFKDKSVKF